MVAESAVSIEPTAGSAGVQERLLVEFELDGECYGVDITDIREIIRYQAVTVIPGAPDIVEGIINLRGRVTPIVDLRKRLGFERAEVNDAMRIIVIDVADALVGVHVDAVTGVVGLTRDQVQALSTEVTTDRSNYLEGVANVDGRLVVLINLQNALDDGTAAAPTTPTAGERPTDGPSDSGAGADGASEEPVAADESAPVTAPSTGDETAAAKPFTAEETEGAGESIDLGLQVEVLRRSFSALQPRAGDVGARFVETLAKEYPEIAALIGDKEPGKQLWSTLEAVVASLDRSAVLLPQLEDLGRLYAAHGAQPAHYEAVGTVLVETLGAVAGELWTGEDRDAWSDAASLAAVVMLDAAPSSPAAVVPPASDAATPAEPSEDVQAPPRASAKQPRAKQPSAKQAGAKQAPAKTARKTATTSKGAKTPAASGRKPAAKKPAAKKSATSKQSAASGATARRAPSSAAKQSAGAKPGASKRTVKAAAS